MESKVSVIIPVFNAEKYLEKCVISVLTQTYTNLEVLIVDDGSTDNSGVLCNHLANLDKRISVFHQKNAGQSSARNFALDKATGDFIIFVDADDYIAKNMVEELLQIIQNNKADVVIFDHYEITKKGLVLFQHDLTENEYSKMIENNTNKIKELVMVDKISNLIWNKIYKKELWQNLRFPIGQCYEDLYIHPQLFLLVKKAAYINKAFYFNNRINENSTTSDNNDFRVHNRYGKFLAYKEHQRIGSSLNWNFVVTWAIDKAINEAIKTFYIDYNSQEKLSDEERKANVNR